MSDVPLREYIEAVMDETRRAVIAAEQEREKAANVLRISLERSIQQGDDALRDHISNQIAQVKASLTAAERAQDKFEESVHARFAQVNEFRGSLDDLGKTMSTRREAEVLSSTVDQKIDELSKQITELRSRLDTGPSAIPEIQRYIANASGRQVGTQLTAGLMFGGLAAVATIITIIVVIANIVTGN
jgi:chromosome segregation ATPase